MLNNFLLDEDYNIFFNTSSFNATNFQARFYLYIIELRDEEISNHELMKLIIYGLARAFSPLAVPPLADLLSSDYKYFLFCIALKYLILRFITNF